MSVVTPESARQFVNALSLPADTRGGFESVAGVAFDFQQAKDQAAVAGADIVSFVRGVTPERRQDIVNASVLAQLVANDKVKDPTQIYAWYDAYFDVLMHIGWAVQDRGFATYTEKSGQLEAHEAILAIAATLLGPASTAFAVIKSTLDALKSMSADSPWMTIFNRESQRANAARFQVMLAEQADDGQFLVSLMAFGLEAKATVTQVLFFKVHSSEVTLKHYSGKVTIDAQVLEAVRELVRGRIMSRAEDFLKQLPPLG